MARERYTEIIEVRIPPRLKGALAEAVEQHMTAASAYVRTAVAEKLKRDGFTVPAQGEAA